MTTRILLVAEINAYIKRGWTAESALSHLMNTSKVYSDYYSGLTNDGRDALRRHIRESVVTQ